MKKLRRILLGLAALLGFAQFVQPDRSVPAVDPAGDMLAMTQAPEEVRRLVVGACYDCHSYRTEYPWYAYVTPVNFVVQQHINEGREVVNYSLWERYAGSEEAGESGETVLEGEMPPNYYTSMHSHGRLSASEKQQLADWFAANAPGEGSEGNAGPHEDEEEDDD